MTPAPEQGVQPDAGYAAARLLQAVSGLVAETHPGRPRGVFLDSDFERDLGLDSLARAEMLLRVGECFGRVLPDAALGEARTPRDLLSYLGEPTVVSGAAARPGALLTDTSGTGAPIQAETLVEALEWHATQHPQRLHVLLYGEGDETQEIAYAALREEASRMATGLVARGLQPRQTVALMLPTSLDYLASFLGVMMAGGIPVPIYPPARLSQIEDHLKRHAGILDNAGSVLIVTVREAKTVALLLRAAVPSLRDIVTPEELRRPPVPIAHRANAHDVAFLQYTSGSIDGRPGMSSTQSMTVRR